MTASTSVSGFQSSFARRYARNGTISNEEFLAGIDHFQNLRGGVVNEGTIRARSATLAGFAWLRGTCECTGRFTNG